MKKLMKMMMVVGALAVVLLVEAVPMTVMADGEETYLDRTNTGEENDPYLIKTEADLRALSAAMEGENDYTGKYFEQTTDIVLTEDFTPIGTYSNLFNGNYNGGGYEVSTSGEVVIGYEEANYQGLFGFTNSKSQISNLGVDAMVVGAWNVGGLVGRNFGSITNCYSTGTVTGTDAVGGLVGVNYGSIANCYTTGTVKGTQSTGGLVGENLANITNCYNTGKVTGTGNVGGLVGQNDSIITACYNTGEVTGAGNVGGLVGQNSCSAASSITNCYNTGKVVGTGTDGNLGGFAGIIEPNMMGSITLTNCYNTGEVTGTGTNLGGFAGSCSDNNSITLTNCFYDNSTASSDAWTSNLGLSTSEMTGVGTDRAEGMLTGFSDATDNDGNDVWLFIADVGTSTYAPILLSNPEYPVVIFVNGTTQFGGVLEDKKVTKPTETSTQVGYVTNWYAIDATEAFDFTKTITELTVLTAKLEVIPYTVTFDSDVSSQTVDYGTKATQPTNPEKDGYTFEGWVVAGTTTAYNFNETVTGDVSLTATWKEVEEAAVVAPTMTEGADQNVVQGQAITFRSDADISTYVHAKVDGEIVDAKYVTVVSGSTVVTLSGEFTDTLAVGTHTMEIVSTDGTAKAEFTVEAEETASDETTSETTTSDTTTSDATTSDTTTSDATTSDTTTSDATTSTVTVPDTGDYTNMMLWVVMMGVAVLGSICLVANKKKIK